MCDNCKNTEISFEDLDGLDNEPVRVEATPSAEERFPCVRCSGTGKYSGFRVNQPASECFSCGGKGWHKRSWADRQATKAKREATMACNLADRQAELTDSHGDLITALRGMVSWNSFAASLVEQFNMRGKLSEKQLESAQRMVAKTQAKQEERLQANTHNVGNVSRIVKMFDDALAAGKNRRALKFAKFDGDTLVAALKLTPARAPRRDLWVTVDGEFAGGIDANGRFKAKFGSPAWLPETLAQLAANPEKETRMYGRKTGECCCCGRQLTDPKSVEAGIGPICALNWGV